MAAPERRARGGARDPAVERVRRRGGFAGELHAEREAAAARLRAPARDGQGRAALPGAHGVRQAGRLDAPRHPLLLPRRRHRSHLRAGTGWCVHVLTLLLPLLLWHIRVYSYCLFPPNNMIFSSV